jgi:5,10-methylenetetrahydromethanopterin reductase
MGALLFSCAFTPSSDTPEHIALAERLGYRRAWCYDSPALYCDVWMTLARAAERTSSIGLGPGVLVPNLRHPMTNAAALATLVGLAPGRVVAAVGSGFTATGALGQPPVPWAEVLTYAHALRGLVQGEEVSWGGSAVRMLHPEGFVPRRPLRVPFVLAASGPKGIAAATAFGGGVFLGPRPVATAGFDPTVALLTGTVLDPAEDVGGERVVRAAGHSVAVLLHALYERYETMPDALSRVPGGLAWKDTIDALPAPTRHLALHELHHVGVNERDRPFMTPELLSRAAFSGGRLRERLAGFAKLGVTEVAYQPAGPDIPRELASFLAAAQG